MTRPAGVVHGYGEAALLVDVPDLAAVRALYRALVRDVPPGVVDVVPAARTVLVRCASPRDVPRARSWVRAALDREDTAGTVAQEPELVQIPVVYDGQDLADVARWAGISVEEVVARHSGREYEAAFGGFAPGFTYLAGVDPVIAAPRLVTPRTRVPAGSVALAGELTAVYPGESPGGWRLLGTTRARMFDVDRDRPALVAPGARVRFLVAPPEAVVTARTDVVGPSAGTLDPSAGTVGTRPARQDGRGGGEGRRTGHEDPARGGPGAVVQHAGRCVEVLATGPLVLLQDEGRPGLGAIGVGPSGAADLASHALANRLVANPGDAATLEATLGGLVLRFSGAAAVALAGAALPATVDGTPVGMHAPVAVPDGGVLRLGVPARGLRTYVAVRGGLLARAVLGSRSWDVLAGIGPRPLRAGDALGVGPTPPGWPLLGVVPVRHPAGELRPGERAVALQVLPGPRPERFLPGAWHALRALRTVTADSNRVALRLDGQAVPTRAGDTPPEGLVRGSVQVPPDGRPVLFLADRPVTGGYPVIGVLRDADVDRAAQLRPGDQVVLRAVREP